MTTQGPEGAEGAAGGQRPPTDEEVRAALEEQMARLTVSDVIVQTVVTLVNLGARRLGLTASPGDAPGAGEQDLEQARLAIEATRALMPLAPAELAPIRDALSQLQVAYARAAQEGEGAGAAAGAESGEAGAAAGSEGTARAGAGAAEGTPGGAQPPPPGQGPRPTEADPEREKARSKIWTPPGT